MFLCLCRICRPHHCWWVGLHVRPHPALSRRILPSSLPALRLPCLLPCPLPLPARARAAPYARQLLLEGQSLQEAQMAKIKKDLGKGLKQQVGAPNVHRLCME